MTKKVDGVVTWPTPTFIKVLQVPGFRQLLQSFIRTFSTLAALLTVLLKGTSKKLQWSSAAETAFSKIEEAFTFAPILRH